VPGALRQWNRRQPGPLLCPYRAAADTIEASGLDYTILRPAWLTNPDEVSYEVAPETRTLQRDRSLTQERGSPRRRHRHVPGL